MKKDNLFIENSSLDEVDEEEEESSSENEDKKKWTVLENTYVLAGIITQRQNWACKSMLLRGIKHRNILPKCLPKTKSKPIFETKINNKICQNFLKIKKINQKNISMEDDEDLLNTDKKNDIVDETTKSNKINKTVKCNISDILINNNNKYMRNVPSYNSMECKSVGVNKIGNITHNSINNFNERSPFRYDAYCQTLDFIKNNQKQNENKPSDVVLDNDSENSENLKKYNDDDFVYLPYKNDKASVSSGNDNDIIDNDSNSFSAFSGKNIDDKKDKKSSPRKENHLKDNICDAKGSVDSQKLLELREKYPKDTVLDQYLSNID